LFWVYAKWIEGDISQIFERQLNLRIMRLTVLLLLTTVLHVAAKGYSQKVTIREDNISLEQLFEKLKVQTGYKFFYADEVLARASPVKVNVVNGDLKEVLDSTLKGQRLEYTISERTVIVRKQRGVRERETNIHQS